MITQATEADARREIARRRTYSGRGFGPRSFECIGINIGIGTGNSAAPSVPSFNGNFGSLFTGVVQYLRSDLGLTKTGSIVNAWTDQSGNGANIAEGASTVGIGNATTGLNGHAGIAGGTGGQYGTFTLALTEPFFYWGVLRLLTSPSGQAHLLTDASSLGLVYANGGPNLNLYNGGFPPQAAAAVGAWGRMECRFSNSASDYVKFGSPIPSTATAGGSTPLSSRGLFAQPGGGNPGNFEVLALVTLNNVPSGAQLSAASAAAQSFYGVSVGI